MVTRRFEAVRRLVSALLALVLLGVQSGIEPGHACPLHDREVQQSAPAGHAGHHAPADDNAGSSDQQNCCTCIGTCVVAAPALLVARAVPTWLSLESTARARLVQTDVRQHPLPRLQPFATAPPLS
jgi:hypothetical protein